LQDINKCYKNSKKKGKLIFKYKKKYYMKNYKKKEIGNNNCQNDILSLTINNSIMYNPQEISNTFNDYFTTVADTSIGNIKKDKNDPRVNVNPSNNLTVHFQELPGNMPQLMKLTRLANP
jgi:DNA replicative helicase MCM subunit Mcm2 (Cdc46/Mcm family)